MVFMAGSSLLVVVHILYNVHISVADWRPLLVWVKQCVWNSLFWSCIFLGFCLGIAPNPVAEAVGSVQRVAFQSCTDCACQAARCTLVQCDNAHRSAQMGEMFGAVWCYCKICSVQCVLQNENVHCAARGARVHYSVATSGQWDPRWGARTSMWAPHHRQTISLNSPFPISIIHFIL